MFGKNSRREKPTGVHVVEGQWRLSKLRYLHMKHISRATGGVVAECAAQGMVH